MSEDKRGNLYPSSGQMWTQGGTRVDLAEIVRRMGNPIRDDLFARKKVTLLAPQFTYQNEYNKGELQWVEKITGTASATHDPTDATVDLEVLAAGDKIIRQSRRYMRYYSGKESQLTATAYTGTMDPDTIFRTGYFDNENGAFIKRDDTTEYIVLRSSGVDQEVPRSEWNRSTLPGFNFDKSIIFQVSLQWLGVGVARVSIELPDGEIVVAHDFLGSGFVESTYMRTANLPIRYEFEATAEYSGGGSSVKQICSAYGVEDGSCAEISKYRHTATTGTTPASVTTTKRAVLAIRPKLLFNGLTNRGDIRPANIDLLVGAADVQWEVVYNPTLTGTFTWQSAGDESLVEYSTDVDAYSGGEVIRSGFIASGQGNSRSKIEAAVQDNFPLGLDVDGADPTTLVIVARSFSGTADLSAAIGFEEIY